MEKLRKLNKEELYQNEKNLDTVLVFLYLKNFLRVSIIAAGILLAFGTSFQNPSIIEKFSFLGNEGVVRVLQMFQEI